jgi:hypothetical protein
MKALGKLAPTISAQPVGVEAVSQRLIATGEHSGLERRPAITESVSLDAAKKLTAFLELESAIKSFCKCHVERLQNDRYAG